MEKVNFNQNQNSWSNAYLSGLGAAYSITGIILMISIVVMLVQGSYSGLGILDFLMLAMTSFAAWAIFVGVITLVSLTVIGTPTVLILKKLKIASSINSAIIGAISTFLFLWATSKGQIDWYYLIFVFYGFACGYAFMYGYIKEENS